MSNPSMPDILASVVVFPTTSFRSLRRAISGFWLRDRRGTEGLSAWSSSGRRSPVVERRPARLGSARHDGTISGFQAAAELRPGTGCAKAAGRGSTRSAVRCRTKLSDRGVLSPRAEVVDFVALTF
jgi:hypothetical protein